AFAQRPRHHTPATRMASPVGPVMQRPMRSTGDMAFRGPAPTSTYWTARRGSLAERTEKSHRTDRWEGRPVQAALVRSVAGAIPVAAGVLASIVFSALISYPSGIVAVAGWWIAVLTVSTLVVAVVERQCRRLLPLATLLKLSMA